MDPGRVMTKKWFKLRKKVIISLIVAVHAAWHQAD